MRLRYAFLCDYAAPGAGNKPTVVGIYDGFFAHQPPPGESIRMTPGFLHGVVEALPTEGLEHSFERRLVDADGIIIHVGTSPIIFAPKCDVGPGLMAYFYLFIRDLPLPGYGDYEWILMVDGMRIGSVELFVHPHRESQ